MFWRINIFIEVCTTQAEKTRRHEHKHRQHQCDRGNGARAATLLLINTFNTVWHWRLPGRATVRNSTRWWNASDQPHTPRSAKWKSVSGSQTSHMMESVCSYQIDSLNRLFWSATDAVADCAETVCNTCILLSSIYFWSYWFLSCQILTQPKSIKFPQDTMKYENTFGIAGVSKID